MAAVGSSLDAVPGTGLARERARPPSTLLRGFGWVTAAVCAVIALTFTLGFLWFISRVPFSEIPLTGTTDGIVVLTSDYHMPRAMAEIAHQLPNTRLVAYPVMSERLRAEHRWASGPAMRLLLTEYVKYIVARARMRLA